jgi:hypothetical protein
LPIPAKKAIIAQYLIVGEGDGDEAFFTHLCEKRKIEGFQFEHASGKDDFETFLSGLQGRSGISALRGLLIVGDNDETPDANFKNIQKQIGKAKLPQPNNPLVRAARGDLPFSLAVLMLPYPRIGADSHGCLESLLLPAAERHLPNQTNCLVTYCDCISSCAGNWNRTAKDKMRLRCLLSGSHEADPNIGLRYALNPNRDLIPLDDQIFDEIELLLRSFAAWMGSTKHQSWVDWIEAEKANHANEGH